MDTIQSFATDKEMRDDVRVYIINFMAQEIIRKTFNNESVVGYHEAKTILEASFSQLEKEYGQVFVKESVNEMI